MTKISTWAGKTATIAVDQTFRFPSSLSEVAADFVQRNPAQLKKKMKTQKLTIEPRVNVVIENNDLDGLKIGVALIAREHPKATVLILSRYKLQPQYTEFLKQAGTDTLKLEHLTIHRSKGREADFAIVIGVRMGDFSFPSLFADDPLLELVVPTKEEFEFAESDACFTSRSRAQNTRSMSYRRKEDPRSRRSFRK
jgi:DNA helicase IV